MRSDAKLLVLTGIGLIPIGAAALLMDAMYSGMTASLTGIMCLALGIVESWMGDDEE